MLELDITIIPLPFQSLFLESNKRTPNKYSVIQVTRIKYFQGDKFYKKIFGSNPFGCG